MHYNVASILQEPTGATRAYDLDDDIEIDGTYHHLVGQARLDRTVRGVLVRAVLRGTMDAECSRCLQSIGTPVDIEIAEEFVPNIDIITGARIETLPGEEEAYRIDEHHELDLSEAVQQYWAMSVPLAPLCREDCPGLCPACGKEIDDNHACAEQSLDERWAKLAGLAEPETR